MNIFHPRRFALLAGPLLLLGVLMAPARAQSVAAPPHTRQYHNFGVAVYARVYEVQRMDDPQWLRSRWDTISRQVRVDKVYIETHRDRIVATDENLESVKRFFAARGVQTAAGIALVANERNRYQTFCYTDPKDRAFVKALVQHTAKHFDEIILDDFFFTDTKTPSDIKAKGRRSWTQFRLDLMNEVARDLILKPARAVNPRVRVVIKFPNWYEHFPGLGYDLQQEPRLFDGIYTGTETRQPVLNAQHLQQYEGYEIVRYFDNIAPGRNGGGWVDTGGMQYLDRYAEQLWLTLFAKAPEVTLFDFRQLLYPVLPQYRGAWQDQHPSLDFDALAAPYRQPGGALSPDLTLARAAGAAVEQADAVLGKLGSPVGVASYKPPYSVTDEDFLHNYVGMLGVPIELRPTFPADARTLFLTEAAAADPRIVAEIEQRLQAGATVVVTSGLVRALQDRGFADIAEVRVSGSKVSTAEFYGRGGVFRADAPILLPQVQYLTNDAWEQVGSSANGYPLLLQTRYGAGTLDVLAVPDDAADLYRLPVPALDAVRDALMGAMYVRVTGPAQVALFAYANHALVVESFLPDPSRPQVLLDAPYTHLRDLVTGEQLTGQPQGTGGRVAFDVPLKPHSYRAFAAAP